MPAARTAFCRGKPAGGDEEVPPCICDFRLKKLQKCPIAASATAPCQLPIGHHPQDIEIFKAKECRRCSASSVVNLCYAITLAWRRSADVFVPPSPAASDSCPLKTVRPICGSLVFCFRAEGSRCSLPSFLRWSASGLWFFEHFVHRETTAACFKPTSTPTTGVGAERQRSFDLNLDRDIPAASFTGDGCPQDLDRAHATCLRPSAS